MTEFKHNILTAMIADSILCIREREKAWLIVDGISKEINCNYAKILVANDLVKIAGHEEPYDVYYVSTFDDFITSDLVSKILTKGYKATFDEKNYVYFKEELIGSLKLDTVELIIPLNVKRGGHEFERQITEWYDDEKKFHMKIFNDFLED